MSKMLEFETYSFNDVRILLLVDLGYVEVNQFTDRASALGFAKDWARGSTRPLVLVKLTRYDIYSLWEGPA